MPEPVGGGRKTGQLGRAVLMSGVLIALAFANAASLRAHWTLDNIGTSRRYWEDLTIAFSLYETRNWGPSPVISVDDALVAHIYRRLREVVPAAAERADLKPWEFWRTVEFRGFRNIAPFEARFADDTGRARLSSIAFRLLGGIAPYLPLWLPFLAMAPLAFWIMFESLRCGEGFSGGIFLFLLSCSAYFLETLTLPYSAAGFHLLAALVIVPLSLFAFGPKPTRRGLWMRAIVATVALHASTWCRASSLSFLPFAALLLLVALHRAERTSSVRRRATLAILLLTLLFAPKALAPKQAHEVWVGVWEGLGDFDREHGHEWSDPAARVALDREGLSMQQRGPYWTVETEAVFRRLVIQNVTAYPLWYGRILAQRVVATVTQWRLRPTARESGMTYEPARHPNEGFVETYYNFVKTADIFSVLGARWEAPLWLLWGPAAVFLGTVVLKPDARARRQAGVVASFAAAALAMPVIITTASGIETQVFVLGYLLSAAFLVSNLAKRARGQGDQVVR